MGNPDGPPGTQDRAAAPDASEVSPASGDGSPTPFGPYRAPELVVYGTLSAITETSGTTGKNDMYGARKTGL